MKFLFFFFFLIFAWFPGFGTLIRKSGSGSTDPTVTGYPGNQTLEEWERKVKINISCDGKGGSGSAMHHNQCRFKTMVCTVYTSYQVAAIDLRHRSQDQQLIVSMVLKSFNDQGTATEQGIDIIIVIKYNITDDYHLSIYISIKKKCQLAH
jgi:hypothetical protein